MSKRGLSIEPFQNGPQVTLASASLDAMMPLHLRACEPGIITHVGPTFAKLFGNQNLIGANLFDLMTFTRPSALRCWDGLVKSFGSRIAVKLSIMPDHKLKAICVPLVSASDVLLNFSLGAGVHEIVEKRCLKTGDFSPADPTGEMLYMMEVQSVLLAASRDLNNRLNGAKMMAEEQAYTDSLTGLNNRRALRSFLARLLERPARANFSVLQIDLDLFKGVNDKFGHAAGDHVLQQVAKMLLSETRSTDMVARVGGDEFVIVLSDFGTLEDLQNFAHRIIRKTCAPIKFGCHVCQIGASVGAVIQAGSHLLSADELLQHADRALYASKKEGGGIYSLAEPEMVEIISSKSE